MRITLRAFANLGLRDIVSPDTCIRQEEALVCRKTVHDIQFLTLRGILIGCKSHLQTTMIREILTQCQTTVGLQVRKHVDGREEICIFIRTLCKILSVGLSPPVLHVSILSILIEAATLIIKSVRHLMTYHDADGTIVKGIVGLWIEEGALQNTCGETDLIGGRIIIGIHCLRCHVPIITIHRFAHTMVIVPFLPETTALTHVLIVRFFGVYLKGSKICPLVRIAHLHIEGIQLEKCIHLRRVVHPVLCCNTFAKGYLQILHECQHALLR